MQRENKLDASALDVFISLSEQIFGAMECTGTAGSDRQDDPCLDACLGHHEKGKIK